MKTSISTTAFLFFLAITLTYPSHPAVANEFSGVGGFEYTLFGIFASGVDL
jgi:hypothetical protein